MSCYDLAMGNDDGKGGSEPGPVCSIPVNVFFYVARRDDFAPVLTYSTVLSMLRADYFHESRPMRRLFSRRWLSIVKCSGYDEDVWGDSLQGGAHSAMYNHVLAKGDAI